MIDHQVSVTTWCCSVRTQTGTCSPTFDLILDVAMEAIGIALGFADAGLDVGPLRDSDARSSFAI